MSNQKTLENAFVLHTRPYRDACLLVDFFTAHWGRITAVARNVRQPRSRVKSLLQPFVPLVIDWRGKSELVTLGTIEANGAPISLYGERLISGLYLNELLMRLLTRFDAHPNLFEHYVQTITTLKNTAQEENLRLFELNLLRELGYGLQLERSSQPDEKIVAECYYHFQAGSGFYLEPEATQINADKLFLGAHLLAMQQNDFTKPEILRTAKRLIRRALSVVLAGKPILSRELFVRRNYAEQ